MNDFSEKRFAVLIDSDNISPKYIRYILDEVSAYGIATYKRIYGDWTVGNKSKWKNVALENSISPIQQYSYTTGKNATDSAMIIDAMDILYSGNVDGFCLVSSDSDFTRLAARLQESGMTVVGMGEEKTPKPFRAACSSFINLEKIVLEEDTVISTSIDADNEDNTSEILSAETIERFIFNLLNKNGAESTGMYTSEIGNRLVNRFSDFDVHDYGYSKFSQFLNSMQSLELFDDAMKVRLFSAKDSLFDIQKMVINLVENEKGSVDMTKMNSLLQKNQIDIRNHGYSKLRKFIMDTPELTLDNKNIIRLSQN